VIDVRHPPKKMVILFTSHQIQVGERYMGLLFWKDNKGIDAFARAVAEDLYSHVQPDAAKNYFEGGSDKSKKKKKYKIEQTIRSVVRQMQYFSEVKSLGVYGKARLQQKFNERLHELGYDESITDRLVELILMQRA
jgi:hypothetical protein